MPYRLLPSGFRDFNFGLIICLHTLCQCTSSKGSGEAAPMFRRNWAFTERICHIYTHFVQGRGAVTALARPNAYLVLSEHWLIENAIYTPIFVHVWEQWRLWQECMHDKACQENAICSPILCMGESSQRSGETERILRLVWAMTVRIWYIYIHSFCVCARAVNALARLNAC